MACSSVRAVISPLSALVLCGCAAGPYYVARHEPWRETEERACLSSGMVRETPFLQARSALGGAGVCGVVRPFVMAAAGRGRVSLAPAALLRCSMVPEVERWIAEAVEPAARARLGANVVEIAVAASYSCRPMNDQYGARLSEHGYANALDVRAFRLDDGRTLNVADGWAGEAREAAFLRDVHDGACEIFTTVLGPDHDAFHRDHFHLDLARRGRDGQGRICK